MVFPGEKNFGLTNNKTASKKLSRIDWLGYKEEKVFCGMMILSGFWEGEGVVFK